MADLTAALWAARSDVRVVVTGGGSADGTVAGIGRDDDPLPPRLRATRRAAARLADSVDLVDAHFALYALLPL